MQGAEAGRLVQALGLSPHPEGGYYRRTYASGQWCRSGEGGPRALMTSIYYLLPGHEYSAMHRLRSDELWLFHFGSPLTLHIIDTAGEYRPVTVGSELGRGHVLQALVPAGCWFGATVTEPSHYALVSCVVTPGFDFEDFELADGAALCRRFPSHAPLIQRLTR